jgi:hypothetical protein
VEGLLGRYSPVLAGSCEYVCDLTVASMKSVFWGCLLHGNLGLIAAHPDTSGSALTVVRAGRDRYFCDVSFLCYNVTCIYFMSVFCCIGHLFKEVVL